MYPPPFDYERPTDLDGALALLAERGDEARVLAGGQSLLPMLKLRLAEPALLVDINRIAALGGLERRGDEIAFGTLCRFAEIETSPLIADELPILQDAAAVTADVQVRNRGTIGGSLVHSDPAGDWSPPLLALDAEVTLRSAGGERRLPVRDFLRESYDPDLKAGEMLTDVRVPAKGGAKGAYLKFEKRAGAFAVASVAVQLRLDGAGCCQDVRVALGALAPTAVRASEAEALVAGQAPTPDVARQAARALQGAIHPIEDTRGSVAYKRHLAEVLFAKAFEVAVARARGERAAVPHL